MSTISASTTTTTAYKVTADTTGVLTLQTGATPTTAMTIDSSQNVGIGTSSPTAKLSIEKSSDAASPSRTPADYSIRLTAAQTNTYNGGICTAESTYVNAAITPIDTGSGGAQGWAFITGDNTSIAERARIDSSGNLLVGSTGNSGMLGVASKTTDANNQCLSAWNATNSGTRYLAYFGVGTTFTNVGAITSNGTATSYVTSSDYRLKENIAPMTGALGVVSQLKPCTYTWKSDGSDGQGFIAHELQEVVPEAVVGEKDAVETYLDEEGNEQTRPVYQGIDTSFLVATLVAAIQELKAEIDTLKGQA